MKTQIIYYQRLRNYEHSIKVSSQSEQSLIDSIKSAKGSTAAIKLILETLNTDKIIEYADLIVLSIGDKEAFKLAEDYRNEGEHAFEVDNNIEKAKKLYELACKLCPKDPLFPNEAGVMCLRMLMYDDASKFFIAARQNFDTSWNFGAWLAGNSKIGSFKATNNLGVCNIELKKYEQANKNFDDAYDMYLKDKKYYTNEHLMYLCNKAAVFRKQGNFNLSKAKLEEAKSNLSKVFVYSKEGQHKLNHASTYILRQLAELHLEKFQCSKSNGFLNESLEYAKLALEKDGFFWIATDTRIGFDNLLLGRIHEELGESNLSKIFYRKAQYIFGQYGTLYKKEIAECTLKTEV